MDDSFEMALTAILVLGGVVYLILHALWILISNTFFQKQGYEFKKPFDSSIDRILLSRFPYYVNLPLGLRPAFNSRVKEFMENKDFSGRKGLEVTDEMATLISAAAIQVTFGLTKFMFDTFSKIIIYPKAYYSRLDKRYHKGEVNLAGTIVFSWEDFKEGYSITDDNYNLGLHEMAHALRFDKFRNDDFDVFFNAYFDKWQSVGQEEFIRIKSGKSSLIRSYAGSNKEEFFAVCVEYFFESPQKMKESHPDLYRHMCILLNQDPLKQLNPHVSVRRLLFNNNNTPGKLIVTSPLSYTKAILPFSSFFILLAAIFVNNLSNGNESGSSMFFSSLFIVLYVVIGGFTISRYFKKFKIYENGLGIDYSLNPILKNEFYSYDNIISITLRESFSYQEGYSSSSDTIQIAFTDGIIVKNSTFIIGKISVSSMEKIAAYLKYRNVLIKIFGKKWSHESIEELVPIYGNIVEKK